LAFALAWDGALDCVSDASLLSYESTHHNWLDVATVTIDGVRHDLNMFFQPEDDGIGAEWTWTYTLLRHSDTGVVAPIELTLVRGTPGI
jgi:hypothetical protein